MKKRNEKSLAYARRTAHGARDTKGTILIWTVLLGVAMTSAFFFISMRLGGMGGIQRESIEYKNQEAYLESYADYIMSLDKSSLTAGEIHFDQISTDPLKFIINGTLINEVDEIVGVLDAGGTKPYSINNDAIVIKWNKCGENGGLGIDQSIATQGADQCGIGDVYDNFFTTNIITSIVLTSLDAPFHYSIKSTTPGQKITDNIWHLKAKIDLGYGKKIEVERVFEPTL